MSAIDFATFVALGILIITCGWFFLYLFYTIYREYKGK